MSEFLHIHTYLLANKEEKSWSKMKELMVAKQTPSYLIFDDHFAKVWSS